MVSGLVSVVIPTFNRIKFLKRTLESISKMKEIIYEIIVIDDCSSCNNLEMIKADFPAMNIRYIRNSVNLYAEKSRKTGFETASGEYVIFCDDDDFYTDFYFWKKAVDILNRNKSLSFVSANANFYYNNSKSITKSNIGLSGKMNGIDYLLGFQTSYKKPLSTFTTVFRKSALDDINTVYNDSLIYMKALLFGDAYFLEDCIGNYTIHENNISRNIKSDFIEEMINGKYDIFLLLQKRVSNKTIAYKWWINQLIVTLDYYYSSNINVSTFYKFTKKIIKKYKIRDPRMLKFLTVRILFRM